MKESGFYGYVNGIRNETEIVGAVNGKKYCDLTDHLRKIINKMFPKIQNGDLISVKKVPGFAKADLEFTVDGESHYLSVKYGASSQVHCEQISIFIEWLKEHNFTQEIIDLFLFYHYGDGTKDGSGIKRMSQKEVLSTYSDYILRLNEALNSDRFVVRDFVKRVVFEGNDILKQNADYIYHGDIEEGEICSKESVLQYVKRKTFSRLINVHIGPIMIRPYARYLSGVETHPEKRHQVTFEWNRMEWDFEYINEWKF